MKKLLAFLAFLLAISLLWHCSPDQRKMVPKNDLQAQVDTSGRSLSLEKRMEKLEERDKPYEEFFNQLEGMSSTFETFFTVLSIILGVISAGMLGIQLWASFRESRVVTEMRDAHQQAVKLYDESNKKLVMVIDEMQKNYEKSMKSQDESNSKLMDAVIRNTNKTTHFIASYENLIKIKSTSEGLNKEIQHLKDEKEAIARAQKDKIVELNGKAMRMVESVYNANFGSTFFKGYDNNAFNTFYIEVAPYISLTESNHELEKYWNADVYFIIGLNYFLTEQSKDAEKYLEKAAGRVESFIKSRPVNTEILFPQGDLLKVHGDIDNWNRMLNGKCAFYIGLNHYRLGRFGKAIHEFKKAFKDFPNEIDPQFFYFQSQYWARELGNFTTAMETMASLSKAIESDTRKDEKTQKMALARLYKKIGDFYLPSDIDDRYAAEKNIERTLEFYKEAYELVQGIQGDLKNISGGHLVPMIYFALGKALMGTDKSWKESPENLFRKSILACEMVIGDIKNPETKYILYYTLAYCQHQLNLDEDAKYSITFALNELDRFCSNANYFGYSPVNNIMIPSQELRDELNTFKRKLFDRV